MVPCTRLIWTKVPYTHEPGSYSWKDRKCAKKSVRFFRVRYSKLLYFRANESDKMEDVFALCAKCADEAALLQKKFWTPHPFPKTKHYQRHDSPSPVFGLRGEVDSWEEIQGTEALFRDDLKNRKMTSVKASIANMMSQQNVRFMDPEDWAKIFDELVKEAVIRSVHRS